MKETIAVGNLVSTRGFLSTSRNPKMANKFGSNDNNDPNKVEVMYEIDVPVGLQHIVFGNIQPFTQFEQEEEILFDLDSSFELIEVVKDTKKNDSWIIRLQASDRGALLAAKYVTDSNRELKVLSAEMLYGKLLIDMGEPDEAINYFQQLLNQSNEYSKGKYKPQSDVT
ncbi:unnamed protein product [Rotaria sp. Silwood2]|nr:unnamed protein product [Rotaria sp. Silwood2]